MKEKKEERGPFSQSFVMGIIALVFLIIGYQTALMIHSAAVTGIVSNRDEPDTVYVYVRDTAEAGALRSSIPVKDKSVINVERADSEHSPRAEAIRCNVPVKRVESFRFDPNTADVGDLMRLGFTIKQARAIDNYRKKGGRFWRKEDFKRSFVVSDSIYRRLEPYVYIPPVDLNVADSAAFDALPGIGGWFASRMLEYRERLGGYSCKEQLMEIWRFDREKYDALDDLVVVSEANVRPYPIWTLPEDSLRIHPYIGDHAARNIVIYRENNPKSLWTVKGLIDAGIIAPEHVDKLRRCIIAEP